MLDFRRAEARDSDDILAWRNDPVAVETSLTRSRVAPDDHARWFASALASPKRVLVMVTEGDAKVGNVRFDIRGTEALVSINLNPAMRGRGYGQTALEGAEALLHDRLPLLLVAEIRRTNLQSLKIFQRAGYAIDKHRSTGDVHCLTRRLTG